MNDINIARRFESVTAAVAEAKLDLSYNERAAQQSITDLDRGYRGGRAVSAFLTPEGDVYYVYAAEGIRLVHRFEPFHSSLVDGPLRIGRIEGDRVVDLKVTVPNTPAVRRELATVFSHEAGLVILPR